MQKPKEGKYGCVFFSDYSSSNKYITKIQRRQIETTDETEIGQQIMTIPHYEQYFAPIEQTCDIDISKISKNPSDLRSYKTLQNDFGEIDFSQNYTSNKIRYVGKRNIFYYLRTLSENKEYLLKKIVNTHTHLLDAMKLLDNANIVHFDLNYTNIMYDELQGIPIIIDFGISKHFENMPYITQETLEETITFLKDRFITSDPFDYWSMDIFHISQIIYEKHFPMTTQVTQQHIDVLLRNLLKTRTYKTFLYEEHQLAFEEEYKNYFSKYINNENKWFEVLNDLLIQYKSWNNYGLTVSYLQILREHNILYVNGTNKKNPFYDYEKLLRNIITAMPNKRQSPQSLKMAIKTIFTNTNKREYDAFVKELTQKYYDE